MHRATKRAPRECGAWNWSSANYFALTGFSEVVCEVAFLKMYRLADVPIRRNSLLFPVGCVTGWGSSSFLPPAGEGDKYEKDLFVVVFDGGSSSPCQRGCTGVAVGEARRRPDGRRARQGYRAGRH